MVKMTPAEAEIAKAVYIFLLHLCKSEAETRVQSVEDGNGLEAWRKLCRGKLVRSSTAAMNALMHPTSTPEDPIVNIHQWDQDALRFESRLRESVADALRRTIYQEHIAPSELHSYLLTS